MEGEIFSAPSGTFFRGQAKTQLKKCLVLILRILLVIMSGFTLLCSTCVESIVLPITDLALKFNSEIVEINETQEPVSWILL